MAISRRHTAPDRLPEANPPIKFLTENGFSIVRMSDIDSSVTDTVKACGFLVEHETGSKRALQVGFDEALVAELRLRRRNPLATTSVFWVVCAESCLANYLWENNEYPPNGRMIISHLSPDNMMLALHWRDRELV